LLQSAFPSICFCFNLLFHQSAFPSICFSSRRQRARQPPPVCGNISAIMRVNLTISQKGLLIFCLILVAELLFVWLYWSTSKIADAQIAEDKRVRQVISHLTKLSNLMQDSSMSLLNALISPSQTMSYSALLQQIPGELNHLRALVLTPAEQEPILKLAKTCDKALPLFDSARETYNAPGPLQHMEHQKFLIDLIELSNSATSQVGAILEQYLKIEDAAQSKQEETKQREQTLLLSVLIVNTILVGILILLFIRDINRRLKVLTDNSLRVVAGQQLNVPLGGNDEITSVDRSFHKMTDLLHEAQRREKAVIDNALDVICSINGDGRFVEVSPASTVVWGYAPVDLLGRRYVELLERKTGKNASEPVNDLIKDASKSSFENRIARKDGTAIDMLWSAQWSARENSWFCVAHDITDRKRAEQLKRDFVAMVSHDLRTPLASVELSLKLITSGACGALPAKAIENVTDAQHNLAFVMILINGLLEFERMNAGKLKLRLFETNVSDVLTRSLEAVHPLADRDGVRLTSNFSDLEFIGDENRLIQVVVNLLSNALKFSPKGSEIKVASAHNAERNDLTISVTDSGPGVPTAEQGRIFQRFERIEQPDSADGAGLGLAISKAIVEQHGGTIGVHSVEGQGSTFYFTIPVEQPMPAPRGAP
jgi:PAS domain S-box-containing protein